MRERLKEVFGEKCVFEFLFQLKFSFINGTTKFKEKERNETMEWMRQ